MKRKKAPAVRPEPARKPAGKGKHEAASVETVRLNKYMADNGIASRRHADRLIEEGHVLVDGELVTAMGQKIDPARQRVEVDGVVLRPEGDRHRYFLLSKPPHTICTNDVREGKRRAIDLIGDRKRGRIYTVGRLDEETTGLVILTNDGDFAHRIGHPRFEVPKIYRVVVQGRVTEADLDKLRRGVRVAEFKAEFDWIKLVKRSEHQSALLLRLSEGRNREIRRVFAKLRLPVKTLHRTQIGPVTDRGLKVGHWRPLLREEIEGLLAVSRGEKVDLPESGGTYGYRRQAGGRRPGRGAARRGVGQRAGSQRASSQSGGTQAHGGQRARNKGGAGGGRGSQGGQRGAAVGTRPPGRRDRGQRSRGRR